MQTCEWDRKIKKSAKTVHNQFLFKVYWFTVISLIQKVVKNSSGLVDGGKLFSKAI